MAAKAPKAVPITNATSEPNRPPQDRAANSPMTSRPDRIVSAPATRATDFSTLWWCIMPETQRGVRYLFGTGNGSSWAALVAIASHSDEGLYRVHGHSS